jgi:hypothetical protein
VGELIDQLKNLLPRDADVMFGGSEDALTFCRLKMRGAKLLQIEFNEQVYGDDSGKLVVHEFDEQ